MNKNIRKRMFVFDIVINNNTGTDAFGDKIVNTFTTPGYIMERVETVVDIYGKEVSSGARAYIDGSVVSKVTISDTIDALMNGEVVLKNRQVIRKDNYYLPGGKPDVGVLYLS